MQVLTKLKKIINETFNCLVLHPYLMVSTIFSVTSSKVGGGQLLFLALEQSWNTG